VVGWNHETTECAECADSIRGAGENGLISSVHSVRSVVDYSVGLAEVVLLGVAAQRAPARLDWDAKAARFTNRSDANVFVGPGHEYRPGWGV
jgi:hypothetical protein